jgi:hypothetical protein
MSTAFTVSQEITGLSRLSHKLPATIGDFKISYTAIHNNSTAIPRDPAKRLTIRDVSIHRCQHWACSAYGVVFDNVALTDVRGGGVGAKAPSFLWGCVFSRVRIRGPLSGLWFRWKVDPDDDSLSRRFLWANIALYESIDWALDISEARFSIYEALIGVPSRLINRDPTRHFVMAREAALHLAAESGESTVWRITAQGLIESGLPDAVIVVGGSGKRQRTELDAAKALIDRGLLT